MDHQSEIIRKPTLLWQNGRLTCTSCVTAADRIEISLNVEDVPVAHRVFADAKAAAQFAVDTMHVYGGH